MPTKKDQEPKNKPKKPSDEEQVAEYMEQLQHPLKAEIEAVRKIIKGANPAIKERIKWNAPSYYTSADLLTFNHRLQTKVHLIFHHIAIVQIASDLLEGDYKDRRMMYFADMADVEAKKEVLERILNEYVGLVG
ncbi:DUF1801 domain-containing protein [Dyadobacter fanqingshengii]|uniref:DUF1801 domain-containing protein n=1 Tax=Dyadobacter fanqingshengii TaxID=2906443 RepID=A0A9X1TAW1_9BACT|nr:DUF1801 domain-containing protein [Dyadobacter fanqingshengii]MCF0041883.1 DUF1801 domain-containing protein [Dyadobacter fanqingshengii]USJ36410.1 DUF1801 domain-containing protein [Dyadobacter fanqingshengii]